MIYTFRNKETQEITEVSIRLADYDQYLVDHPNLERYHSTETLPGFGDAMRMSVPGTMKADSGFEKYVINRIKETVPGNTLARTHKTVSNSEW
jgi:hypothetical protein